MAKTQFTADQFKTEAVKPLFAAVGATDLAVEYARGYATEAQKATQAGLGGVQTRVTGVQAFAKNIDFDARAQAKALPNQALTLVGQFQADALALPTQALTLATQLQADAKTLPTQALTLVSQLQADAKDAQAKFEARIAEVQKDALELPGKVESLLSDALVELTSTYDELAERGEKLVAAIRKDGVLAAVVAKPAPVKKAAAKKAPAKKAVKAEATGPQAS